MWHEAVTEDSLNSKQHYPKDGGLRYKPDPAIPAGNATKTPGLPAAAGEVSAPASAGKDTCVPPARRPPGALRRLAGLADLLRSLYAGYAQCP